MEFGFRIIVCNNGTEIIDRNKTTAYSELTPLQMVEYTEVASQLSIMDFKEKRFRIKHKKSLRHPFQKFASMCGLF